MFIIVLYVLSGLLATTAYLWAFKRSQAFNEIVGISTEPSYTRKASRLLHKQFKRADHNVKLYTTLAIILLILAISADVAMLLLLG